MPGLLGSSGHRVGLLTFLLLRSGPCGTGRSGKSSISCASDLGVCSDAEAVLHAALDPGGLLTPALVNRSWTMASAPSHGRESDMSTDASTPIWLLSEGRTGALA
eukprot:9286208-Pyramimonas_sp.AAC.1